MNHRITLHDYMDGLPAIEPGSTYQEYLQDAGLLGRGFEFDELVKPRRKDWRGRFQAPPEDLWARMAPTLAAANELRRWVIGLGPVGEDPIRGLRVAAAYRPRGGARFSQHKRNAALDLDLLPGDYDMVRHYYEIAVRFWCEYGASLKMGLGLYASGRSRGGIRVHIDTGYRCRTWQISGGTSIRPHLIDGRAHPLAHQLAHAMCLVLPTASEVVS